jgi:hypothetical protein
MAGVAEKLRGPGKGPLLRNTRAAVKALIGAGCDLADIEIQVTADGSLVRRAKQCGEAKAPAADADWDKAIAKKPVPVR